MSSFIFTSSNSVSEKDFASLITFDANFREWFEVVLANEKELEILFDLLGVDRIQKVPLSGSEDFEKLYDYSQCSLPEYDIEQFDSFYEHWLEITGRESDMDEYGQLIFIQGRAVKWNKNEKRIVLRAKP